MNQVGTALLDALVGIQTGIVAFTMATRTDIHVHAELGPHFLLQDVVEKGGASVTMRITRGSAVDPESLDQVVPRRSAAWRGWKQ
jgi:hypothetical protein